MEKGASGNRIPLPPSNKPPLLNLANCVAIGICHIEVGAIRRDWEYACREGGKKVRFGTGKKKLNKQDAHFGGKMRTMPVGSFKPNALGLYDMAGNLQEWVFDGVTKGWGYKLVVDETDNPMIEGEKVMRYARGGSWMSIFKDARCARRRAYGAESPHTTVGFRVAIPGPESARAR